MLETRPASFGIYPLWLRVGYASPPQAARRSLSGCTISNNRCSASCLRSGVERRNVYLSRARPDFQSAARVAFTSLALLFGQFLCLDRLRGVA